MTSRVCPSCGQPQADGLLCAHRKDGESCTEKLRKDLEELPGLMRNLRLTYSRQSKHGNSGRRNAKASEGPLPWDNQAAKVHAEVVNTVGTWIRVLDMGDVEEYRRVEGCRCKPYRACKGWWMEPLGPTMTAWCKWLLERMNRIRGHEAAGEMASEIREAVRRVEYAIDLPPDKVFAGPCPVCGAEMYARKGAAEVACRKCAEVAGVDGEVLFYDVADRREWLQRQVHNRLATAQEILTAVPSLYGVTINSNTFKSWVTRGQLDVRGQRDGQPLYSVDVALGLATRAAVSQGRKREATA